MPRTVCLTHGTEQLPPPESEMGDLSTKQIRESENNSIETKEGE